MSKAAKMTSSQVLEALRKGPFDGAGFELLYEVRSRTGYGGHERYADALVASTWPSRGVWIAGLEVKVSRSDWLREFRDPAKATEIQQYCDYWFVAVPDGIVEAHEIPEAWGLYTVDPKGKVTLAKAAPKLAPKPLDKLFVASVLRNAAAAQARAKQIGASEGYDRAKASFDTGKVAELEVKVREHANQESARERAYDQVKRDLSQLQGQVAAFERAAGLPDRVISGSVGYMGQSPVGDQFKAARLLATYRPDLLRDQFRELADAFAALWDTSQTEAPQKKRRTA